MSKNIVLVEISSDDGFEAEAFKNLESFKAYFMESLENDVIDEFLDQLENQKNYANIIIELDDCRIEAYQHYHII